MSEFTEYLKFRLITRNYRLVLQVVEGLCLGVVVYGGVMSDAPLVATGIVGFVVCRIYDDYTSMYWKHELRESKGYNLNSKLGGKKDGEQDATNSLDSDKQQAS